MRWCLARPHGQRLPASLHPGPPLQRTAPLLPFSRGQGRKKTQPNVVWDFPFLKDRQHEPGGRVVCGRGVRGRGGSGLGVCGQTTCELHADSSAMRREASEQRADRGKEPAEQRRGRGGQQADIKRILRE